MISSKNKFYSTSANLWIASGKLSKETKPFHYFIYFMRAIDVGNGKDCFLLCKRGRIFMYAEVKLEMVN